MMLGEAGLFFVESLAEVIGPCLSSAIGLIVGEGPEPCSILYPPTPRVAGVRTDRNFSQLSAPWQA